MIVWDKNKALTKNHYMINAERSDSIDFSFFIDFVQVRLSL